RAGRRAWQLFWTRRVRAFPQNRTKVHTPAYGTNSPPDPSSSAPCSASASRTKSSSQSVARHGLSDGRARMPTNRVPLHRRRRHLTWAEEMSLEWGEADHRGVGFTTEQERRIAWERQRDYLMAKWSAVKNPISDGFELGGKAERNQDSEQQKPQPCEEAAEVIAGGGEHGIGGVAAGVGEVISAHAVVLLEMADDGLDGGPPFEFAFD